MLSELLFAQGNQDDEGQGISLKVSDGVIV